MFLGHLKASLFFKTAGAGAIISLIVVYYQSLLYGHPTFPHQYISKVTQHYPQYVVFRMSTISGAVLMFLGWLTNYFFLQTVSRDSGINLKNYHIQIPLVLGLTGSLLLMGNTATIDTGVMINQAHLFCARNFFIFTILAQIYNTVVCAWLQSKTKLISKYNLYLKYFILFLLVLQVIYGQVKENSLGVESDKGKFLEWTTTVTVISMFISIGMDVDKYQLVYVDVQKQQNMVQEGLLQYKNACQ